MSTTSDIGRIWPGVNYADAKAGIAFLVDVLGFTERIVVPGENEGEVAHAQIAWPEGGTVMASSASRGDNPFSQLPTGAANIYVVTADPAGVYQRCLAANAKIVAEPSTPDYDPGGSVFTVADTEGNLFSFGSYAGGA